MFNSCMRIFRKRFGLFLCLIGCVGLTGLRAAHADLLADVRARGVLVVGVKKDVPLWGQIDPSSGQIVGFEPDLARRVADHLGVRLQLKGLLTAERISAVTSGEVDLLIATLSDTPERRAALALVAPHYYASGVNIMARKRDRFRAWADLRNRRVCGRRGAFYNRAITVRYGADVIALYSNALGLSALRDGRCAALLHDDTSLTAQLQDAIWSADFEMPLATLYTVPWSMALHPQERGGAFERVLSDLVVGWLRQGTLAQTEARWGIPGSVWVRDMQARWQQRDAAGRWVCGERVGHDTPVDCL